MRGLRRLGLGLRGSVVTIPPYGGGGATLDPTLSTPVLIDATSGGTIALDARFLEDYGVGDTVYLIAKNKAGATVLSFSNLVDSTEATDSSAGTTGRVVFTGLSAVSLATTYRWTTYVEKAGGATYGPSSNLVITGPDDIEPTLTLPTSSAIGATFATIGITTDDGLGTIYWVVTTSATVPSKAQIKAGQNHLGASAGAGRFGSAAPSGGTAGAKTFAVSGTTASTVYYYYFMHEDPTGNQSAIANGTYTSVAVDPSLAELHTTTGTNKRSSATITGTPPLSYSSPAGDGNVGVRSTLQQVSNKAQFEYTITANGTGNLRIGIEDGTTNLNTDTCPGFSNSAGFIIEFNIGRYVYLNWNAGANQHAFYPDNIGSVAVGDIFTVVFDKAGTMELWRTRSGTTTQAGTTKTGLPVLSAFYAFIGTGNTGHSGTINFGATAYAKTPGSGVASIWA